MTFWDIFRLFFNRTFFNGRNASMFKTKNDLPEGSRAKTIELLNARLPGGVLESVGRLFRRSVKMYVYPTRDPVTGEIQSPERAPVPSPWHHLRALLLEIGRVEPIRGYDESYLSIRTPDVLARIQRGGPSWEQMVPAAVAEIIKAENLFGWRPGRATSTT
jgi:hypothetical protein